MKRDVESYIAMLKGGGDYLDVERFLEQQDGVDERPAPEQLLLPLDEPELALGIDLGHPCERRRRRGRP